MAHFRTLIQNDSRSSVTRLGHHTVFAQVNGWESGVEVNGRRLGDESQEFTVYATGGSNRRIRSKAIAIIEIDDKGRVKVTYPNRKKSEVIAPNLVIDRLREGR